MIRFWSAFLIIIPMTGALASEKPGAQSPEGVVSVEYLTNPGPFSGMVPPSPTPEQAWLSVTVRRSFPTGAPLTLPAALIRVTDSAQGSYPLIGLAGRWKSKGVPVYRILKGAPVPSETPVKAPPGQGGSVRLSGGWTTLLAVEGGELKAAGSAFFEDENPKKELLSVTPGKGAGEDQIAFHKSPLTLNYVFLVPRAAQGLQLRFGSEDPVALVVK